MARKEKKEDRNKVPPKKKMPYEREGKFQVEHTQMDKKQKQQQ